MEAAEHGGPTGSVRDNFRGYKLVRAYNKLLIARRRPVLVDRKLLSNNEFTDWIIGGDLETCLPALSREVIRYISDQRGRLTC